MVLKRGAELFAEARRFAPIMQPTRSPVLELVARPPPEPGEAEVRIRVLISGVSTDRL